MIVDKINEYLSSEDFTADEALRYEIEKLAGWSFQKQFMDNDEWDSTGKIYMSSIGKCPRQLAYKFHGFEKCGKGIDGRARFNFWFGDMIELALTNLAKLALQKLGGGYLLATGFNQIKINLKIDDFQINGYPDGVFIDENGRVVNFEVKSMSSYRFRDFEKGIIDDSYLAQVNAEMEATYTSKTCMLAVSKDSGVFGERIIQRDEGIIKANHENVKKVLASSITINPLPEPNKTIPDGHELIENIDFPKPRYQANDNSIYPWQCLYCSYWKHCHTNAEIVFEGKRNILKETVNGVK